MVAFISQPRIEDDFLAQVTDIAYQAVLRHGLNRSFLEVELDLWQRIRSEYHTRARGDAAVHLNPTPQ